jgi:4-hydroxy-3-polyprenylbenzoate decarboxylase
MVVDARIKPHHAPQLEVLLETEKAIEKIFNKGGSLYGKLN